jgi:hypothetical protein
MRMERTVRTGERQAYATAVTGLWERVGSVLVRLERIADAPSATAESELLDELPGLQYRLHAGAELAVGIDPPFGAEAAHGDLVAALADARDATAEIAGALESHDSELVQSLLPEWRGSLFRVRLARLRVLERPAVQPRAETVAEPRRSESPAEDRISISAVLATLLVLGGALLFTAGAVLVAWPLWAAGLALVAGGFVLYRP